MIDRYNIFYNRIDREIQHDRSPVGEWVLWSDVEELLEKYDNERDKK